MTLYLLSDKIDSHLAEFCGSPVSLASRDFIATLSEDFMSDHCPDVLNLPGSLVALNNSDEAFVTIHLSGDTRSILERAGGAPSLLGTEDGLSAALILIEEISHFHHFVERATNSLSISRFDLEVLAEVEKVAVCSLLLEESFGHNHIHQVIHKVFNESNFHGSITNYKLIHAHSRDVVKNNAEAGGCNSVLDWRNNRRMQETILLKSYPRHEDCVTKTTIILVF